MRIQEFKILLKKIGIFEIPSSFYFTLVSPNTINTAEALLIGDKIFIDNNPILYVVKNVDGSDYTLDMDILDTSFVEAIKIDPSIELQFLIYGYAKKIFEEYVGLTLEQAFFTLQNPVAFDYIVHKVKTSMNEIQFEDLSLVRREKVLYNFLENYESRSL